MAAAAVDLTQVLQGSPELQTAASAPRPRQQLQTVRGSECLSSYLLSLGTEIANDGKPLETRQIAGVLLKNVP